MGEAQGGKGQGSKSAEIVIGYPSRRERGASLECFYSHSIDASARQRPLSVNLITLARVPVKAMRSWPTQMSFTITRNLEQLPSYPMLCKMAEQNHVRVTGNERTGTFSSPGVEGTYEFVEDRIHGTFGSRGVTGEFSVEIGTARVTITDKPFWLPEVLLRQKIMEGLDTFCSKLAERRSS